MGFMSFDGELQRFLLQLDIMCVKYTRLGINYSISEEEIQNQAEKVIGSKFRANRDPDGTLFTSRIKILDEEKLGYDLFLDGNKGPDELTLPLRFRLDYILMSCSLTDGDRYTVAMYPHKKLIGVEEGLKELYEKIQEAGKTIGYSVEYE